MVTPFHRWEKVSQIAARSTLVYFPTEKSQESKGMLTMPSMASLHFWVEDFPKLKDRAFLRGTLLFDWDMTLPFCLASNALKKKKNKKKQKQKQKKKKQPCKNMSCHLYKLVYEQ